MCQNLLNFNLYRDKLGIRKSHRTDFNLLFGGANTSNVNNNNNNNNNNNIFNLAENIYLKVEFKVRSWNFNGVRWKCDALSPKKT